MQRTILIANNGLIEECDNDGYGSNLGCNYFLFQNNTINKNVVSCNYTTFTADIVAD
jgi:hypothetical protein